MKGRSAVMMASALTACSFEPPPLMLKPEPTSIAPTYEVGGAVSGLLGSGLLLGLNGVEEREIQTNGSFSFATRLESGADFVVTVLARPTAPLQRCSLEAASGTIADAPHRDLRVVCAAPPPAGILDDLFGVKGVASLEDPLRPGTEDQDRYLGIDGSGRLLLTAIAQLGDDVDGLLWRVLPDGAPDPSFGRGGRSVYATTEDDYLEALASDADGNIFVTGSTVITTRETTALLLRFDPDGSLRQSFGSSGVLQIRNLFSECDASSDGTAVHVAFGLAMDSRGRILVSGNGAEPDCSDRDMFAIRVDAETGALDPTFGDGGSVQHQPLANGGDDGRTDNGRAIIEDGSGAVVVAGSTNLTNSFASADAVLWRYRADGSLDPSFGDGGYVVFSDADRSGGGSDVFFTVAADAEGRFVAAGRSFADDYDALLVRVHADGRIDPTFGGGVLVYDGGRGDDRARRVLVDGAGRIMVAGSVANGRDTDIAVWRLHPDGSADRDFGDEGLFTYDGGHGDDDAHGLVIEPSGRIIVSGTVTGPSGDTDVALLALTP